MKKKLIMAGILVLAAILLVAASVLGTLAFLASSSAVSNTFTYGNIGIHMKESKVDDNGEDIDDVEEGVNLRTVDQNSYKLVPNKNYCKDPAIYVDKGGEPSYLFVKIKNGISAIEKSGSSTMKAQMIANGWQLVKANDYGEELYLYVGANNADEKNAFEFSSVSVTPMFVGGKKDAGGNPIEEVISIFSTFTVAENAKVEDYEGAKVILTAFAIQAQGFEDKANGLKGYQYAWNAVVDRFTFEAGTHYDTAYAPQGE